MQQEKCLLKFYWAISKCCSLYNEFLNSTHIYYTFFCTTKHFTLKQMKKCIECLLCAEHCNCTTKTDSDSTTTLLKLLSLRSKALPNKKKISFLIFLDISAVFNTADYLLSLIKCPTLAFMKLWSPDHSFSISFNGLSPNT